MFEFSSKFIKSFQKLGNKFDIIGNIVHKSTYALTLDETWNDNVVRVISGNQDILINHCEINNIRYDCEYWNTFAEDAAIAMQKCQFIPGGRILKNLGTEIVRKHGALRLNNCAAVSPKEGLAKAAAMCEMLLSNQCGVGFDTTWDRHLNCQFFVDREYIDLNSMIYDVIHAFETDGVIPQYQNIKNPSGKKLYDRIILNSKKYIELHIDKDEYITNIFNSIGCCVFGEKGRGSEIAILPFSEKNLYLKNYDINPHRADIGWLSNNSIKFESLSEFENNILPVAKAIQSGEDIGIINMHNIKKYGRIDQEFEILRDGTILDMRENDDVLLNPCAEEILENNELCNLISTVPSNCKSLDDWLNVNRIATIFASINSLLPTNYPEIDEVISKNRRIGVSISGLSEILENYPSSHVINAIKKAYRVIRETNYSFAKYANINVSKKVTTIKPDGTISHLINKPPGIHYPVYDKYAVRNIQINERHPICSWIEEYYSNLEYDIFDNGGFNGKTRLYRFPIKTDLPTVYDIGIYEQILNNAMLQKYYSDSSVSNTIHFNESDDLESTISKTIRLIKTMSFLPTNHTNIKEKYGYLPYDNICKDEYIKMTKKLNQFNNLM